MGKLLWPYTKGVKGTSSDATAFTLADLSVSPELHDRVIHVEAIVLATETADHDEVASYHLAATFKVDAGVLSQVGTTTVIHTAESTGGWAATLDASGTTIRVRATGAADTDIRWSADVYSWGLN